MRETAFIPFKAYNGKEYELRVSYDPGFILLLPESFEEGPRGEIFPVGGLTICHEMAMNTDIGCFPVKRLEWESLSEMTRELRIEIISWGSDIGN